MYNVCFFLLRYNNIDQITKSGIKFRVVKTNRCVSHVVDKLSKATYGFEQKINAQ